MRVTLFRLVWLATTAFLLNGNWEWMQTPFFLDQTASVNEIVWFRIHCTVGDVLILLGCASVLSAVRRSADWLSKPQIGDLTGLTALGVAYTAWSEHVNLARGSWVYSDLMPLLPGTELGLVPILQWLVLPSLSVRLAARLAKGG